MQTNNTLKFLDTYTIEQFKADHQVPTIKVKKNPNTGKLFFTYGNKVGAVSSKGIPSKPVISLVEGDGEEFYLLHNEGQGAETLAAF